MEKKKVLRVDRSPMNPRIWCLELECRHGKWVTAVRKPTRITARCSICEFIGKDDQHVAQGKNHDRR